MDKPLMKYALAALLLLAAGAFYYTYFWHGQAELPPKKQSVAVKVVHPEKVQIWSEFPGRLQAVDAVEIKPEVSGRITEVRFEDGNLIRAGDILFVIDPRPFEAAVAKAEAKLATATTNAHFAKIEMDRATKMIATQAIAQRIYDERYNSNQVALADIKSAEAELKQANIDLEHAYVRAPISGRAGRVELTLGNLVQAGPNAPLMTRIIALDPIYADFDVDEQTYLASVRSIANDRALEQKIPVELFVQGDQDHSFKGMIYTFDNRIDTNSGTIRARAKFSNPKQVLVPGMFVTIKLASGEENDALLVPQQAIGSDQSKKFVYVVDKDNKVVYREIELGKDVGAQRIVKKGLKPDDRVVINGLQHIQPDETVDIQETKPQ